MQVLPTSSSFNGYTHSEMLSFLPLPLDGASKEHYLPFSVSWRPNEKVLPSHQTAEDAEVVEADAKHKSLFVGSKIRAIINCEECFKSRCIYALHKLQWEDVIFQNLGDEKCTLVALHSLHLIYLLLALLWCSKTSTAVFQWNASISSKLISFPPVFYYCGISETTSVEDAEIEQL